MIQTFIFTLFADYSCDAYSANAYGQCAIANGGVLANTGYSIIIPLAFGIALLIASAIWLTKRILRRRAIQK